MGAVGRPPGPKLLPIIGNNLAYLRGPLEFIAACKRDHGDIVRGRLLGMEHYLLFNPAAVFDRSNHDRSCCMGRYDIRALAAVEHPDVKRPLAKNGIISPVCALAFG